MIDFFVRNNIAHLLKQTASLYLHFEFFSHVKSCDFGAFWGLNYWADFEVKIGKCSRE